MTRPLGKIAIEAGSANEVLFAEGVLWAIDGWSRLGTVSEAGFALAEPGVSRPRVLGGRDGRVAFSFRRAEPLGDGVVDVVGVVVREPSLELGKEQVLATFDQAQGVYPRFMAASPDLSAFAMTLASNAGAIATLVVWREGRESARYERVVDTEQGFSVSGIAFSSDGSHVLVSGGGQLIRCPVIQGTPVATPALGFEAFRSLGGAEHLPVAGSNVLLHQYPHGALGLFAESGEPRFVHVRPQGYFTRELRRSVASMSPDGQSIAAAVAAADALEGKAVIEVFDPSGLLVRRIEWKCAKTEYASDVAIDDEGWIALATNKKLEVFPPEGYAPPKKSKRA